MNMTLESILEVTPFKTKKQAAILDYVIQRSGDRALPKCADAAATLHSVISSIDDDVQGDLNALVPEDQEQDDYWDWNSQQPQQYAFAHVSLLIALSSVTRAPELPFQK